MELLFTDESAVFQRRLFLFCFRSPPYSDQDRMTSPPNDYHLARDRPSRSPARYQLAVGGPAQFQPAVGSPARYQPALGYEQPGVRRADQSAIARDMARQLVSSVNPDIYGPPRLAPSGYGPPQLAQQARQQPWNSNPSNSHYNLHYVS